MLISCPDCQKSLSDKAQTCPHCGCPRSLMPQTNSKSSLPDRILSPSQPDENLKFMFQHKQWPSCSEYAREESSQCLFCGQSLIDISTVGREILETMESRRPKCMMCGGTMQTMDAGSRGSAFALGNLFGALSHTHRCKSCGHLA